DDEDEEVNKISSDYDSVHPSSDPDTSDSDQSEDEVIIKGKIKGRPVSLLYDMGAKKNLLPARLFPSSSMTTRFKSATGHPIRSSGAKRFELQVNGRKTPIKAYVNDYDLSILGRQFTKKCKVTSDGK